MSNGPMKVKKSKAKRKEMKEIISHHKPYNEVKKESKKMENITTINSGSDFFFSFCFVRCVFEQQIYA